jgi:hypothetical protein
MVSTVDCVSEGVSGPRVANCNRFGDEWTPDLESALVFLLATPVVLSLYDKFSSGGNEMAIFSRYCESLKGSAIVNTYHIAEGENDMICVDF